MKVQNSPEIAQVKIFILKVHTLVWDAENMWNLMMLKWLNEKGCPWSLLTFAFAAQHGSLGNMN